MSETGSVPGSDALQHVKLGDALLRPIVFSRPLRLVEPTSWATHIPFAFWLVEALAPRSVLELGTMTGNSFAALAQAVQALGLNAACYCVDTWKGDAHAGFFGEEVFEEWSAFHDRHFGAFSRVVRSTFDEALAKFEDGSVDLLHIDGFHTYEAVRHDFDSWRPKLSSKAVVILHDVNVRERNFGVWRFWEELKDRYPCFGFLHGHGLGVVGVGRELPPLIRWLLEHASSDDQSTAIIRQFFGTLGEALVGVRRETAQSEMRTELTRRLSEREAETARVTTELDARVTECEARLTESAAQLKASETQVKECEAQLREATQQLAAERSHAERTSSVLRAEFEKRRAELLEKARAEKATFDQALLQGQEAITEITRQNAAQAAHHVALLHELDAVYNSKSWRWTEPLRNARRTLTGLNPRRFVSPGQAEKLRTGATAAPNPFPGAGHQGVPDSRPHKHLAALPEEFDRGAYLTLNPDVAAAGLDPVEHYLTAGRLEGRVYQYPRVELRGTAHIRPDRDSILVVSHEASRTGAPIVSLNLVSNVLDRYTVVALLLDGGSLVNSFEQAGAVTVVSHLRRHPMLADAVVGQLHDQFRFKFALVNSVESRVVLRALAERFVPVVSLLHEFAAYTLPRDAFPAALLWSSDAVFSANITRQNALQQPTCAGARSVHTIPQGRCVSLEPQLDEELENESERLRRWMRPADGLVIVLGAGSVQVRKGVDLFIDVAARVLAAPGGTRCRFLWLGNGYDPDGDAHYSAFLADQIQRAGLEEHVLIAGETRAIETAYTEADIFLMSSRLDPMPNVAIDALSHGKPVLCFDKATGIADFLKTSGLSDRCVARYLDTADMADKICALASSKTMRQEVGEKGREASSSYFDMTEYVKRLEALALTAIDRSKRERHDVELILGSGLFRPDFEVPPQMAPLSLDFAVRRHVRAWASGIDRRKPFPGFHPGIYLEQHGVAIEGCDPTADFIRAGRPVGAWNSRVIIGGRDVQDLPANESVALHLHVYYSELLPDIMSRLSSNRCRPDLLVSVTSEEARDLVARQLDRYEGTIAAIEVVPNRGRDIGPFLTHFGRRILSDYIYVGHIHTKKTEAIKDKALGKTWFTFLVKNLLGDRSEAMADAVLASMKADPSIGIVFPDDPNPQGWNANRGIATELASKVGITTLPQFFNFPVGTMFWARTCALSPLIDLNLRWDDYPEEPLPYDGTLLHAIERLLPLLLSAGTLRAAVTNVSGVTR